MKDRFDEKRKNEIVIGRIVIFLIANFGALALGSLFTSNGVSSNWYQQLDKAPWTPPGWMFGVAWTLIMICFSIYLALLWKKTDKRKALLLLYVIQWVLNVSWNPVFFHFQHVLFSLGIILLLTILIGYFLVKYHQKMNYFSILILPYFVWLIIASSLNAFIYLMN